MPDASAVLTPEGSLSYDELDRAVSWTAASFKKSGLVKGDIVGIDLSNQTQHLISSLALARLGVGQFAFDADPPRVRQNFVKRLKIVATVTDKATASDTQTPCIDPPPDSIREFIGIRPVAVEAAGDSNLPFLIMRTSGTTTGVPKLGLLTHAIALSRIKTKGFGLPEGPGSCYLALASLSFNSVKYRAFHCLLSGGCLALYEGTGELQLLVDFVIGHRIDYLSCSPIHAVALLSLAKENAILLPGVEALRIGTTIVPQALREDIQRRLTPNLYIAYGVSEVGTIAIAPPMLVHNIPGVVGKLIPGIQAEVIDDDGVPLPPGFAGKLRMKSSGMITGYVDAPAETDQFFRDGWFYSSDMVEFTANRELIHHGRADDVMIFDGININPAEIENVLLRHPAVSEAAAFPIHSTVHGDTPFAAVVIKSQVLEDELLSHCRSWLGLHSPQGLFIVSGLPRNAAGKVLKNDLQRIFREQNHQHHQSDNS